MKAVKKVRFETIADLLAQLGAIDPQRIRADPPPGTATEQDLIAVNERKERLFELVDGVLVEKVVGYSESALACELIYRLKLFLHQHDLGVIAGEAGAMRLLPGLVRIPDVSFISWERLPKRTIPTEPVAGLAPDLAVEVLSPSNTRQEMVRKVKEYFFAGVQLVWLVDKDRRTVEVFTAPDQSVVRTEGETVDGGDVLPGLALPIDQIFAALPSPASKPTRKRGGRRPPR